MSKLGITAVAIASAVASGALSALSREQSAPPVRGREVYDKHCAECHGTSGRGDGPAAHLMTPRPRDFTAAKYKIRTTETGSLPTDEDLLRSVRQGLYGSAMPGWQKLLSEADIRGVVDYVKAFSPKIRRGKADGDFCRSARRGFAGERPPRRRRLHEASV